MSRPVEAEQELRSAGFVRSLAELGSFASAASASKLDARRVLRLLDEDPAFRAVAASVLRDQVAA